MCIIYIYWIVQFMKQVENPGADGSAPANEDDAEEGDADEEEEEEDSGEAKSIFKQKLLSCQRKRKIITVTKRIDFIR